MIVCRGLAQVRDYDTFLIYQLLHENTFFWIALVLLKISENFLRNAKWNVWIKCSQIKEKSWPREKKRKLPKGMSRMEKAIKIIRLVEYNKRTVSSYESVAIKVMICIIE